MGELKHTLKTDILFKLIFTKHPDLLKKLVAQLLRIPIKSINTFEIRNTEIPPDSIGMKLCRLDIHMTVNEQEVNLEVQVKDEGDFPERVLYHWARIYSNTLLCGRNYKNLPQTIIINIIDFPLFKDSKDFHSEFQLLEVTRKTPFTNKQILHFFELPKLPKKIDKNDLLLMWLALFKANTEEEFQMIEDMSVSEINEVVTAYRHLSRSPEFRELERQRDKAEMDESSRISYAEERGEARSNKRWKSVVADKDAALANKDATIADKDAEIESLKQKLADLSPK